jgi:hypothetical protein
MYTIRLLGFSLHIPFHPTVYDCRVSRALLRPFSMGQAVIGRVESRYHWLLIGPGQL